MEIAEKWISFDYKQRIVSVIYIFSFLIATSTHILDLLSKGILPYTDYPFWANLYWTILTILNPIAVLFFLFRIRMGVLFIGLIIVSDVIINCYFTISVSGLGGLINMFMLAQASFLVFYIFTHRAFFKK